MPLQCYVETWGGASGLAYWGRDLRLLTLDSGGKMWFSSWLWNTGPALYPLTDT